MEDYDTNEFDEIKKGGTVGFSKDGKTWVFAKITDENKVNEETIWLAKPIVKYYDTGCSTLKSNKIKDLYSIKNKKYKYLLWLNKNPFKSEKQRRYMYEFHPRIAKRWSKKAKRKK